MPGALGSSSVNTASHTLYRAQDFSHLLRDDMQCPIQFSLAMVGKEVPCPGFASKHP